MACIIDHHFTRALVDSAVLRCVRSRTTMYLLVLHRGQAMCQQSNLAFNGCDNLICIVSDVNDAVHVEAHDFIRNCAHLVGEAILVPTVLLRGNGHGTRRVPDVLSYCVPVWTADPEINVQVAASADLVGNRHLIIDV